MPFYKSYQSYKSKDCASSESLDRLVKKDEKYSVIKKSSYTDYVQQKDKCENRYLKKKIENQAKKIENQAKYFSNFNTNKKN
jgi:cell division septum initiation protein DivIVA